MATTLSGEIYKGDLLETLKEKEFYFIHQANNNSGLVFLGRSVL